MSPKDGITLGTSPCGEGGHGDSSPQPQGSHVPWPRCRCCCRGSPAGRRCGRGGWGRSIPTRCSSSGSALQDKEGPQGSRGCHLWWHPRSARPGTDWDSSVKPEWPGCPIPLGSRHCPSLPDPITAPSLPDPIAPPTSHHSPILPRFHAPSGSHCCPIPPRPHHSLQTPSLPHPSWIPSLPLDPIAPSGSVPGAARRTLGRL